MCVHVRDTYNYKDKIIIISHLNNYYVILPYVTVCSPFVNLYVYSMVLIFCCFFLIIDKFQLLFA